MERSSKQGPLRSDGGTEARPYAWLAATALIAAVTLVSFSLATPYPDDQDGVNFLLGVERYDPQFHRPHFPGYPVYMALGKLSASLSGSAEAGLIALSVLSVAGCAALVFAGSALYAGYAGALALAVALLANPVLFEFSHKMYSEPLGLFILMASFASPGFGRSASWGRWVLCGLLAGLLAGVRLSWWPYPAVLALLAWRRGGTPGFMAGAALGVAVWFVPMMAVMGFDNLLTTGASFVAGHFGQWGGAIGAANATGGRAMALASGLWQAAGAPGAIGVQGAFQTVWTAVVIAGAALWLYRGRGEAFGAAGAYMMATAVYILWVAAGQNVWNERHYIPVIPAVAVAVAPLARLSPKTVAAGALALALSIAVNYADRGASTPPVERMRAWLEADRGVDTIVYCGNAERFFDRYPARVAVRSVPSYTELDYRMKTELGPPVRALVCDDIPGFSSTSAPVAVFEARPGDPVDRPLGLYELDGVWPDKAAKGESTSRTPETGA